MANFLWGKIFFQDYFAGIIRQAAGDQVIFEYDPSYRQAKHPALSHTLPLQEAPHLSYSGLHPFFDNLVAEGWLETAQTRLLGKRITSRFELLLAFGFDCAGAVSIIDPDPKDLSDALLDTDDSKELSVLTSRASLSGVQPKLAALEKNGKYYPARLGELSTHIAKFSSPSHPDLIINEFLTTQAFKALLPNDDVVDLKLHILEGQSEPVLIIKRFDRSPEGRIHFEEFNQLLNKKSAEKYEGSHKEMSDFIQNTKSCLPVENHRLFNRILAGILLGNTDMHFKNFALFHTASGLRLTPSYDEGAASLYKYKTIALAIGGARDINIADLKAKHIIALSKDFSLSIPALKMSIETLKKNKSAAKEAIASSAFGTQDLKDQLIDIMEKRWNGTFDSIGTHLSKKP